MEIFGARDYKVYGNVPTFMCHKYGMYFNDLDKFGIIQNTDDQFRGGKIAILYDPGMFPALIKNPNVRRKIEEGTQAIAKPVISQRSTETPISRFPSPFGHR
ncbi:hypothetical protein KQX54_017358 [Cotesia glomerata]|uniref:Uncharacterized protein n=1 Tax=Cotesia glomerata TaxID=32391 RepID=A0AAV7HSK0_COTGL|nr:hypothetical protein KQX54_017358 [Cotesia glomerata]